MTETMTWECRFVNMPSGNGGDDWFELREVYYDSNGQLFGHGSPCVGTETLDGIVRLAQWWQQAAGKPPLHEKDFPADFKPATSN